MLFYSLSTSILFYPTLFYSMLFYSLSTSHFSYSTNSTLCMAMEGENCVSVCVLSTVYFYNGKILPEFCSSPVSLKLSLIFLLLLQFLVSWAWIVGVWLEVVLSWLTRGPVVQVGLWRLLVSRSSLYFVGLML